MSDFIDWPAVKERVRQSEQALKLAFERGGQELDEAFRLRAQLFSRRRRPTGSEKTLQVLSFRLGDYLYGWPLTELAGVRHFTQLTPVPEAPAELLGVVSHRGSVMALLSLKRMLFESSPGGEGCGEAVILKKLGVACRVDELLGLVELVLDQIQSVDPPDGQRSPLVGIGPQDLRILSAESFAQHSYFQTQEVRL